MTPTTSPQRFATVFLVANLHCPTCVSSIKCSLKDLEGIEHVSPNIITSCVAVEHKPSLPINQIVSKLETAGFEVSGVFSERTTNHLNDTMSGSDALSLHSFDGTEDWLPRLRRSTRMQGGMSEEERTRAHLRNCDQCRTTTTTGTPATSGATAEASPAESSDRGTSTEKCTIASAHSAPIPHNGANAPGSWMASLAISGMTCAACANTITSELERKDWITKVTINLVSNSAVVEYLGAREDANQVVESIDDLGYGTQLDQVNAINDTREKENTHQRTVQIRIDGFYCPHCCDRAVTSVAGFRRDLRIHKRPTLNSPFLEITYSPQAPAFTVRHILAAIEASDPAFTATIHRPPTIEERAKKIQEKHQRQILIRAFLSFFIAIPTFVIGIVYMSLLPKDHPGANYLLKPWLSGISRAQIILCVLATIVYFLAADIFHRRAVKEIRYLWRPESQTPVCRRLFRFGSMNMLISLGTTIAYVASIAQMIAAAARKSRLVDDSNFYFDSVVFLTMFLLVGRFLEAYSKSKTGNAVEALGKLRPTTAILVEKNDAKAMETRLVDTEMLEFGDVVRVPHGASPPCDGEVLEGRTAFNEASLTGESRLVKKDVGDQVFSGAMNQGTPVLVRITGTAGRSMLDQIVKVVREGQTRRAPSEKWADAVVAYFVPAITLIAILTWLIWLVCGSTIAGLEIKEPLPFSLQFAIAVFVVACPCGLALAGPTAIFVGSGLAAGYGILVKGGGEAFETASRVDCFVFDKTGTLTVGGEPSVTDCSMYLGESHEEQERMCVLAALQAVEENSSHPIAKAVVNYCKTKTNKTVTVNDVEEVPGKGVKASCEEGFEILVGNEPFMQDYSVVIPPAAVTALEKWKTEAKSVALVAIKSTPNAEYTLSVALAISDPIRQETPAVIRSLQSRGCDVWMLSGDNAITAKAVALRVGIPEDNVIAGVLPVQKADKIKYLQSVLKARKADKIKYLQSVFKAQHGTTEDTTRRATVAMVGDGINDAPALSTADVGIAIGSGSDVAISSAHFVLVNSNLASVVHLLDLSRLVFRRIIFNFVWALVYNVFAIPLAAGCLYRYKVHGKHIMLDPVWASLAMALSSFSVVISSLALKTRIAGIGFRPRDIGVK